MRFVVKFTLQISTVFLTIKVLIFKRIYLGIDFKSLVFSEKKKKIAVKSFHGLTRKLYFFFINTDKKVKQRLTNTLILQQILIQNMTHKKRRKEKGEKKLTCTFTV